MNESTKGTIKAKIGDALLVKDPGVGTTIKNALVEQGYDLVVRPIMGNNGFFIGEEIEVFRQQK